MMESLLTSAGRSGLATGPGPQALLFGDLELGLFGEVTTQDFITGNDLASKINLVTGTAQLSNTPWLKFAYKGKVLFVARVPFRHTVTYNTLNSLNVVTGQRIIQVQANSFRIRLLKGIKGDSVTAISTGPIDPFSTHGSEWNDLIYRVCTYDPASEPKPNWLSYSESDILAGVMSGGSTWCQEASTSGSEAVIRGTNLVGDLRTRPKSSEANYYGWRPVLELV